MFTTIVRRRTTQPVRRFHTLPGGSAVPAAAPAPVLLLPGQGGYRPGVLSPEEARQTAGTLRRVAAASAAVGGADVVDLLTDPGAPSLADLVATAPERLHLAIFSTEIVAAEALRRALRAARAARRPQPSASSRPSPWPARSTSRAASPASPPATAP
ncbi:hypothetical protein GCM10025868_21710 [Angustibacter aerolatus]|uniref:Uncharacterized protein n=1 Tax=Angustibacter aerolatus TaxID=1162965 RepID=A0ABQ6JFD8_9ACTN|nr:hypothetical protein GCM10025868_21710 [Angustibacter aerolatus]